MSKIYVCEFKSGQLECKRVFQEENEEDANKFAQRRAGGIRASLNVKVIRDGAKIYQIVSFTTKKNEGLLCLKNNKTLALNKSNISDSINKTLPEEVKAYLTSITGVTFDDSDSTSSDESGDVQQKEESVNTHCYYKMLIEMFKN